MASGVARLHGGTVVLESRSGQGTVVRVSFPALRDAGRLASEDPPRHSPADSVRTELSDLMTLENFTARFLD